MSETPRVWIVTCGSYSDYRICHVFAAEELAEAYIARETSTNRYDDFDIEEWNLLTAVPAKVAIHRAYARLEADGTLSGIRLGSDIADETPEVAALLDKPRPEENQHAHYGGIVNLSVNYRRTPDEAQKALYDLAARVKADRAGIA